MKELKINTIDWNQKCWRYFKTDRLIDALENGNMYFAAATEYEDKFEGATFLINSDAKNLLDKIPIMFHTNRAFEELQRLTKINCWHKSEHESDLMWKVHAQDKKGVAITTTPQRMKNAFKPYRIKSAYGIEDFHIGNVEYVDLTTTRINDTMLGVFYYKHNVFEAENELRLSISLRIAEEFGVEIPKKGIFVSVDYSVLIDEIIIGPNISQDDHDKLFYIMDKLGFKNRVKNSCLTYAPIFI